MPFSVNEFKSQLVGGGARPTLYQVQITNPIDATADFRIPFMVKAAQIPSFSIGSYELKSFGGVSAKFGGDRTYEDWSVTVLNDETFDIRNAMERWSNAIHSYDGQVRALPQNYKSTAQVTQYSKNGNALRTYIFEGIFPLSIDAIDLGFENNDSIEEFGVTFQYDMFRVEGSTGISTV